MDDLPKDPKTAGLPFAGHESNKTGEERMNMHTRCVALSVATLLGMSVNGLAQEIVGTELTSPL